MMNLVGIILPAIIDLVNRYILDKDKRFWVSVVICSLFGIVANFIENNGFNYPTLLLGVNSIATSILAMFGIAQIVYKGFYENSSIQGAIRGDEAMRNKQQD